MPEEAGLRLMASEPKGMMVLGQGYWLDEHGVVYERWGEALLRPARWMPGWVPGGMELPPWAATQATAPYRCGQCGTDRLQVFESDDRETSVRCPECRTEAVVHSE